MGDLVGHMQAVQAGMMAFDVRPEQADEVACEIDEAAVVHGGTALAEVLDQYGAHIAAAHAVGVDQVMCGTLPSAQSVAQCGVFAQRRDVV